MYSYQQEEYKHVFDDSQQIIEQVQFKNQENSIKEIKTKKPSNQVKAKLIVQCSSHKIASNICLNSKCFQKNGFLCCDKACACHQKHKLCSYGCSDHTLNKIHIKLKNVSINLKLKVQKIFEDLINKISDLENYIKNDIEDVYSVLLLKIEQKQFLEMSRNQNHLNNFTGNKLRNVWDSISDQKKEINDFRQFDQYFTNILDFEEKCLLNVNEIHKKLEKITENHLKKENQRKKKNLLSLSCLNSIMIKQQSTLEKVVKFFHPQKKVKAFNVIYRASENKFDLIKYLEKWGEEKDILIILKGEGEKNKEKIFGGYTPLPHKYTGEYQKGILKSQSVPDVERSTFLFSLTNNEVFKLKDSLNAITRYLNQSKLQFGAQELVITPESNLQQNCYMWNIGNQKSCFMYPQIYMDEHTTMQEKRQMINGSKKDCIKVKEWEAWKVRFEQEKKW